MCVFRQALSILLKCYQATRQTFFEERQPEYNPSQQPTHEPQQQYQQLPQQLPQQLKGLEAGVLAVTVASASEDVADVVAGDISSNVVWDDSSLDSAKRYFLDLFRFLTVLISLRNGLTKQRNGIPQKKFPKSNRISQSIP
jgi:hypothetical protein